MKEKYLEIPSKQKGIKVHGTLRGTTNGPLVVLAPGLGGWMHDLQMFNASRAFELAGYSTLRLSFYGHDDNQRNIKDFGAKDNADDIDAVVSYLKKEGCSFVAVAGHSYSGLGIAYSVDQEFDAGILWDPTHTDGYEDPESQKNLERDFIFNEELQSYISGDGPGYVLAKKVFDDYGPGSKIAISKFKKPLLVVNADDHADQISRGKDYVDNCPSPSTHVVIPDSSHPFTEDGAMERLFAAAIKWLDELRGA